MDFRLHTRWLFFALFISSIILHILDRLCCSVFFSITRCIASCLYHVLHCSFNSKGHFLSHLVTSHSLPSFHLSNMNALLCAAFLWALTRIKHPHCTLICFLYSYLPPLVYNLLTFPKITDIPHPAIPLWVKSQFSGLVTKIANGLLRLKLFPMSICTGHLYTLTQFNSYITLRFLFLKEET